MVLLKALTTIPAPPIHPINHHHPTTTPPHLTPGDKVIHQCIRFHAFNYMVYSFGIFTIYLRVLFKMDRTETFLSFMNSHLQ